MEKRAEGWRGDLRAEIKFGRKRNKSYSQQTIKVIERLNNENIGNFNERSLKDISPLSKAWIDTRVPVEINDNI